MGAPPSRKSCAGPGCRCLLLAACPLPHYPGWISTSNRLETTMPIDDVHIASTSYSCCPYQTRLGSPLVESRRVGRHTLDPI